LLRKPDNPHPFYRAYDVEMAKLETIVTAVIDNRKVEAKCSICHDVILAGRRTGSLDDQETELRDAIDRHTQQRHCLAKLE